MKYLCTFLLIALCLWGCSTDPLDQKYTTAEGMQPLLSDKIKPPIDEQTLFYIKDAEMTNQRNGVPNVDKTFRELKDQGIQLYAERESAKLVDSLRRKAESEVQAKQGQ